MEINVLANCACSKSVKPLTNLQLRAYTGTFEERMSSFYKALTSSTPTVKVRDLYTGSHWAIVRSFTGDLKSYAISAGYGLVPFDMLVSSYSATFELCNPDSVFSSVYPVISRYQAGYWWDLLCKATGRSIATLMCRVMVVASPNYVEALEADLTKAKDRLGDELIIVTSLPLPSHLEQNRVPVTTELARKLRVPGVAVTAAVGAELLKDVPKYGWSAKESRERYIKLHYTK